MGTSDPETRPGLLERITGGGIRNLLVIGLHPGSGKRTILAGLARAAASRGLPIALAASPRLARRDDLSEEAPTVIPVPEGTLAVVGEESFGEDPAAIETVLRTGIESTRGELILVRAAEPGNVALFGPSRPGEMKALRDSLSQGGTACFCAAVGQDHRAFLEPGLFDGAVISTGLGYAPSEVRAVAAARYQVETLDLERCDERTRLSFDVARSRGEIVVADREGTVIRILPADTAHAARWLVDQGALADGGSIILPGKADDELLRPLVQAGLAGTVVVQDATRLLLSPIYWKAWAKNGGRVQVVHRTALVAVAVNPTDSVSGNSVDPERFRASLAGQIPIPVHDVVLESDRPGKKRSWKFWT